MPPFKLDLPPPREEERLEDLCRDLWSRIWGDRDARKHGRRGQKQFGVDVFGKSPDGWEGVQCKKKGRGKELTEGEILAEIQAAEEFPDGPLKKLTIATTAPRDIDTQGTVRRLSDDHEKEGGFPVVVSAWEDILEELDRHEDLIQEYYSSPEPSKATVTISSLPVRRPHFLGRQTELHQFDDAWSNDATRIIVLIGVGGVGKSALISKWLETVSADDWRGAEHVLGWSFYRQGTEPTAASADAFVDFALRWLKNEEEVPASPWERGVLLAHLVQAKRTLLVLDGLEPLQHPPGTDSGRLRDPAIRALLRELAMQNNGLCVVTTRLAVADLTGRDGIVEVDLERLPPESGAELLRQLGVQGTEQELQQACDEYGGNALALTLLGNYLTEALDGDVRQRGEVKLLDEDVEQGGHARRVMASYASWFGEGAELQVLHLMGLFDRPAEAPALVALRKTPVVPGLTEGIVEGEERTWRRAMAHLRRAGLLAPDHGDELDAHPLVRAFFREKLQSECPEAWRAGNQRLYEYYRHAAPEFPDTLDEMMPLYVAVVHGCRAGYVQEALTEVHYRRIRRGGESYSVHKLGAFGPELTALSTYFDRLWDRPFTGLSAYAKAWVLSNTAFALRAQGRPLEALRPMKMGLDAVIAQKNWKQAAAAAGNVSESTLTLGAVSDAVTFGEKSVQLADLSGDSFYRMGFRTTLADALHQAGKWRDSEAAFREAEKMQAERQPQYPRLYALQGFRYCELLLSKSLESLSLHCKNREVDLVPAADACRAVLERAKIALDIVLNGSRAPLDIALNHLSIGRAHLGLAQAAHDPAALDAVEAANHLDQTVGALRLAAQHDELPRGLLGRAALRRFCGDLDGASADASEAKEIAERGHMRLFECDAYLETTRIALLRGDVDRARRCLAAAREIVEETGYGRREREVDVLARAFESA